jgi:transposase-like protein
MGRKPRVDRSPEEKWQIVQKGIKSGNVSETCRRHGIAPNLFYRWKDEAEQGAKAALGGRSAQVLADKALAGDLQAAREIADRAEGRPRQSPEIENSSLREAFDRMTREELETYARDGALPEWFPRQENVREAE